VSNYEQYKRARQQREANAARYRAEQTTDAAKGLFGPWLGCIAAAAIYGWPFAVFHGAARLAVGIPWLVIALAVTALILAGRQSQGKPRQESPAGHSQRLTAAAEEAATRAIEHGIPRDQLGLAAQLAYDRLTAGGAAPGDAPGAPGVPGRKVG
jgi:hypothetical protein